MTSTSTPRPPPALPLPAAATPPSLVDSELMAVAADLTAGTLGACAGIVAGQPLDTIKLRMQTASNLGVWRCIANTARQEGVRAFYKGMLSPLAGNAPINAIVFGARGNMARMLDSYSPRSAADIASGAPDYWRSAATAAWGGAAQLVVCVPTELVKCKMQVQSTPIMHSSGAAAAAAAASAAIGSSNASAATPAARPSAEPHFSGSWDCARYVYRTSGLRGLYSGFWVTFWRDVPAYAAWFVSYDWTKARLQGAEQLRAGTPPSTGVTLMAGSVAGIATWISTYPFDVLKSVIQTSSPGTPARDLKMWNVAARCYREEGARFFFKGLTPTLLRAVPVSAVTFWVYEACMGVMGRA